MRIELPVKILAPAKVNLCLYVGERRSDGLHEICSLFQSVSLADALTIEAASGETDVVGCPGVKGPNLAAEALDGYRSATGWVESPLEVEIEKHIPLGAGLGGGSADAAAVLRAINALAPKPLGDAELARLAMGIGADVPSQLSPGLHLVCGAGELVEPLGTAERMALVLVLFEKGLSTAEVYMEADRRGDATGALGDACGRLRALAGRGLSAERMAEHVQNDLQASALALMPQIEEALNSLRGAGALATQVTGSGPTVFGLFSTAEEARLALAETDVANGVLAEPVGREAGLPRSVGGLT